MEDFSKLDLSHIRTYPGATGPYVSFGESFHRSFERERIVNAAFGFDVEVTNRLEEQMERLQALSPDLKPLPELNSDVSAWMQQTIYGGPAPLNSRPIYEQRLARIQALDAAITAAKAVDPTIRTLQEIYQAELDRRAVVTEVDNTTPRTASTAFASQLGQIAGSLDPERDPLYFLANLMGAGARLPLLVKLGVEALIGGGAEGAQQALFIQPRARALGEAAPDPLQAMLLSAAGSAAFRALGEAGVAIYRRTPLGRASEARARAEMEADIARVRVGEMPSPTLLRALLDTADDADPRIVAAKAALDVHLAGRAASPWVDSPIATMAVEMESIRAFELFEGRPDPLVTGGMPYAIDPLRLEVAPPARDSFEVGIARQREPQLYHRLDEVEGAVTRAETRVSELERQVEDFDHSIRSVEQQIDAKLKSRQEQLLRELATEPRQPSVIPRYERKADELIKEAQREKQKIATTMFMERRVLKRELASARSSLGVARKKARPTQELVQGLERRAQTTTLSAFEAGRTQVAVEWARQFPEPVDEAHVTALTDKAKASAGRLTSNEEDTLRNAGVSEETIRGLNAEDPKKVAEAGEAARKEISVRAPKPKEGEGPAPPSKEAGTVDKHLDKRLGKVLEEGAGGPKSNTKKGEEMEPVTLDFGTTHPVTFDLEIRRSGPGDDAKAVTVRDLLDEMAEDEALAREVARCGSER